MAYTDCNYDGYLLESTCSSGSSKMVQQLRRQEVEYSKICGRLGTGMKPLHYEISMVSLLITTIFSKKFINYLKESYFRLLNKRNDTDQNDKNEILINSIRKDSRIFEHLEAIRQCRNNIKQRKFDISDIFSYS